MGLGYHKAFGAGTAERLEKALKEVTDSEVLRRIQAVYFRAKHGYGTGQIAKMTGYAPGTVRNLHAAFFRDGMKIFDLGQAGGQRPAYMTQDEEGAFLKPFFEAGDKGSILEVGDIHRAHSRVLGHKIALSTTYRLLHRHGWRKIMPRSRHPKADEAAQAAFKKMA